MYVTYTKILAHVHDHVQRFYITCRTLGTSFKSDNPERFQVICSLAKIVLKTCLFDTFDILMFFLKSVVNKCCQKLKHQLCFKGTSPK